MTKLEVSFATVNLDGQEIDAKRLLENATWILVRMMHNVLTSFKTSSAFVQKARTEKLAITHQIDVLEIHASMVVSVMMLDLT